MPYLDQAAAVLLPAVTYKLSNDVRCTAVEAMPDLVRALKAAVDRGMQQPAGLVALWGNAFTQLMQVRCAPALGSMQRHEADGGEPQA